MNRILLAVFLSLPVSVMAQTVEVPVAERTFDISGTVKNLEICYILSRGEGGKSLQLAGGLYKLPWNFHAKDGTPFVEPAPGFAWDKDSGVGGPIFAVGVRADNLYSRMLTNQWMRDHYLSPKVPYIKIGPLGGYINRLGWFYGGFVSLGLGR